MNEKPFWQSKKFWAAVVATLVPAANYTFGWGLDIEEIMAIDFGPLSYIFGQGFADFGKNKK